MSTERIKWTQGRWSETGSVNGLNLFSVGRGTMRQDDMYYLGTELPVRASSVLGQHYPTPTHAKVAAEQLLTAFIDRLTLANAPAEDNHPTTYTQQGERA